MNNAIHQSRREFLSAAAAGSAALSIDYGLGSRAFGAATADLAAARKKAAHRRRRVILNNDGNDIWARGADTREKFLAFRHGLVLGTHVDSISYCTTQSFNHFSHGTKVAEPFLSREGQFAHNNLGTFLKQGTDNLLMSAEFAHQHGLESIWSLHMNDVHDTQSPVFFPQWKRDDPSRIMSTPEKVKGLRDSRQMWSLVDYEHPDVAPRLLAIIEEVLQNYSVDGVELDFLRSPFFFRTNYEGKPATEKQGAVMLALIRSIRKLVLRESQRQKKPFLLGARVPVTSASCRWIGIDIQAYLEEQLIDVMTLSGGYVAFDQPVEELIALGHKHDVPVYPCLSRSGLAYRPPRGDSTNQLPAAWFGAAMCLWEAGADGICVFNLHPGQLTCSAQFTRAILKTIGSREAIANANRIFAISDAGSYMPAHYWAKDVEEFSEALPVTVKATGRTELPLVVAGPVGKQGHLAKAELRLDFSGLNTSRFPTGTLDSPFPAASLNGRKLESFVRGVSIKRGNAHIGHRFIYEVPLSIVKHGQNTLEIEANADTQNVQLNGADLWLIT